MAYTVPRYLAMIRQHSANKLLQPSFFEDRQSGILGIDIRTVKPIIQFQNSDVNLRYNVGTRGNGTDAPQWPEDLSVEIVR
jgi:hypothetical protein